MQQWEYMVVTCGNDMVVNVNGVRVAKTGLVSGLKGEPLWDFLNQRGAEGWELVAVTSNQYGGFGTFMLKRPLISEGQ